MALLPISHLKHFIVLVETCVGPVQMEREGMGFVIERCWLQPCRVEDRVVSLRSYCKRGRLRSLPSRKTTSTQTHRPIAVVTFAAPEGFFEMKNSPFVMSPITGALLHRRPASASTSHSSSLLRDTAERTHCIKPNDGNLLSVLLCRLYVGCPESIQSFWTSREPVAWPWCNLAASL